LETLEKKNQFLHRVYILGNVKCLLLNNKIKNLKNFDESNRKCTTDHVVAQSETKIVYENETRKENEQKIHTI